MIDKVAQQAVALGYKPKENDFKQHVVDLTCPQSFWTLKEIHQLKSSTFSKKIDLDEAALS